MLGFYAGASARPGFDAGLKKAVLRLVLGLTSSLCEVGATTITNYLAPPVEWQQFSIAVNVGDTVVWVNPGQTNYVESYGGEWKSPLLGVGDSFAFTFTNSRFYAYHTGTVLGGAALVSGAVTVNAWTGAPPALMINTPVEGSVVPAGYHATLLQATLANGADLLQVEYFANSTPVGVSTNAPYAIQWQPTTQGPYTLVAKGTNPQGGIAWSEPIHVCANPSRTVWGARVLPSGEVLFFYNALWGRPGWGVGCSTNPIPLARYTVLVPVFAPGVFVDGRPRQGVSQQFYAVVVAGPP